MSDSIVFSITTSPPPVQVVKPAQTVSTSETSFQDVLRAQTEASQPRDKAVAERSTTAADRPTEAAKTNKPVEKEVSKGEDYSEDVKLEKPVEEEQPEEKSSPAVTHEVKQPVPELTVMAAPVQVTEPAPVVPAQTTSETAEIAQTVVQIPNTVPAGLTLQQASTQQLTVNTNDQTFQDAVSSADGQQAQSAQEIEEQVSPTRVMPQPAQPTAEKTETAPVITSVEPEFLTTNNTSAENIEQKPVVATKSVETEQLLKSDEKTSSLKAEVGQTKVQEQSVVPGKPEKAASPTGTDELKVALEKAKVEGQVEKTAPKQVQAPPGQQQIDGIAATGKMTFTPQTTQIIEPARLAEAQTIDMIGQITRQLDALNSSGRTTFRLQLSPQDLGQIDLKITTTSQGVGVTILAENGATSKLLETQVAQLRQSLLDAGVQISNLHVGAQGSQSHQSQAQSNYPHHHHQVYSNPSEQATISDTVVTRAGSTLVDYKI